MGMRHTYVDTSNLSGKAVTSTLRRLLHYIGLHRREIGIAFAALSVASLLNMVPPWALKIAVDDFIPQADAAGAVRIAGALMLIYLARGVLNYVNFYLFASSSQTIVYELARDMFKRLVRHSMRFFEGQRTGETVSHLTADVTAVQQAMQGQVLTASAGLVTMVLYLVVMLMLDWRLTLVILAVVPLMLIASTITARMLRVRYRQVQESIANINTAIEENVSGVRVSRAFAREEADARRFQTENRANLQANLNTTMVESVATPLIEGLSALSVAALLAYGGWQITLGEMQPGTLIAFLAYVQIFHQPLTELVRVNYVVQSGLAAADRIFHFMDIPRHIVDRPSAVDLVNPRGRVEFRNVNFSYDGVTPVLQDISVTAEPGQTVALVGVTGSGKTTMVNLIARFYDPTSGQVWSTATTCATCGWTACAHGWPSFRRRRSCSAARSPTTCATGILTRPTKRWRGRRRWRERTSSSGNWTMASPPWWETVGYGSRAGSSSAWRWRGRSCRTRRCWCWTKPRPTSTPSPNTKSRRHWCRYSGIARAS